MILEGSVRPTHFRGVLTVEVVGAATVREEDGLALSSRNKLLTRVDRVAALALSRALRETGEARVLIAARVGSTRLIDNMPVRLGGDTAA